MTAPVEHARHFAWARQIAPLANALVATPKVGRAVVCCLSSCAMV